jgi:hypothetical protein
MKQVNLKEFNITELDFVFWTKLTDDLLEKIRSVVTPDEDDDYIFINSYKIDNVGHVATAMVSKAKGEGKYRIRCRCEIGRGGRLGKGIVSVSKLFEIISSIKEKMMVISMLKLSFGRRQKHKTIISLPIKITDMPKTLYDEIHGIHFVKREGRSFKYEVILDLEENGTLIETIINNQQRTIKESIIEDIIRQGIEISDGFVLREKQ